MGLDTASAKFVCSARSLGVDFSEMLMVGRQLFFPEVGALRRIFSVQGIDVDATLFLQENKYGEGLFSLLGAREISSLDYSSYENATILHDLNSPIPKELHERFSVVYDGGTLEHVFNIPQAFKNCMEMVKVGGHFLQVNEANNFMGHGFWQFSPELLFRVFSPENGFEVEVVFLHEVVTGGSWYVVSDPDSVHRRVELCNSTPTYILTIAKRVSNVEVFTKPPLQSDYSALWGQVAVERLRASPEVTSLTSKSAKRASLKSRLRSTLPEPVKRFVRSAREELRRHRRGGAYDKTCYRYISEDDLLRGKLGPTNR